MALLTAGTVAATSLEALVFNRVMTQADFASLQNKIKYDGVNGNAVVPGAFTRSGFLVVPRRGILQVLPGDVVAVDATGWPVLVSATAIDDGTDWVHS